VRQHFILFALGSLGARNRSMLEILFFPIVLLAAFPGGALLPAIVFTVLYLKRRSAMSKLGRTVTIVAALTWIVYGIYETRMYFWMKTVIAPIRVDLLLIVPILYVITIIATIVLCRGTRGDGCQTTPGRRQLDQR
jgi:hypothetical protein